MWYVIEYDTNKVLFKSKDGKDLAQFKLNNEAPIALIDSPDELCLEFTLSDMELVYSILTGDKVVYSNDIKASCAIWGELKEQADFIEDFTDKLGTKYLNNLPDDARLCTSKGKKVKSKKDKSPIVTPMFNKPKKPKKSKGVMSKDLISMVFCKGSKDPKQGTSFCIFIDYLEENLDEASYDDLVQIFIKEYKPAKSAKEVDAKLAKKYVRRAFNGNYIEEAL